MRRSTCVLRTHQAPTNIDAPKHENDSPRSPWPTGTTHPLAIGHLLQMSLSSCCVRNTLERSCPEAQLAATSTPPRLQLQRMEAVPIYSKWWGRSNPPPIRVSSSSPCVHVRVQHHLQQGSRGRNMFVGGSTVTNGRPYRHCRISFVRSLTQLLTHGLNTA